ncbi:glycosyltransferase family 2 protein [Chlamydiota bacterium]
MKNEKISIVVPVYNEEKAIAEDLKKIKSVMDSSTYDYEIIVVNDGSNDGTECILKNIDYIKLISHVENRGVGAARKTGIKKSSGEIIVMTDGDGSYPNDRIPDLISEMEHYDMVVGARKKEAGTLRFLRSFAKLFIRKLAEYISGSKIPDLNSGMRVFKKSIALKYFGILPEGHSWVSTITLAFLCNAHYVKFVPINYFPRKGKSSFHPIKDTSSYFGLVIRTIMYFKPLKIFVPLTIMILGWGVLRSIYDATVLHRIKESDIMIFLTGLITGAIGLLADLIVKVTKKE